MLLRLHELGAHRHAIHLDPHPFRLGRDWDVATKKGATSYLTLANLADPAIRHDGRSVHWHSLRHTCASSLIAGWWGRAWRIEEVKEVLGHKDIRVTQRYAHLAPGVLGEGDQRPDAARPVTCPRGPKANRNPE